MKTKKYCFILAVVVGIFCVPAPAEIELHRTEAEQGALLGQANPTLVGIKELYVVIEPSDTEPNKNALVWEQLEETVKSRLQEAGIKIAP
jgi:hypothetical protein